VTGTNPPPDGSERAAARLRAGSANPVDKPAPKVQPGPPSIPKTPLPAQKSVVAATAANSSAQSSSAAQRPRTAAATAETAAETTAPRTAKATTQATTPRQANGAAKAPPAAPAARALLPPETPARRSALAAESTPARISASSSRAPGRSVSLLGEPDPPLSERLASGLGASSTAAKRADPKPITPRSPRTALDPDTVEAPLRRSKGARHPLIIIGNAVISIFVLLAVVVGFVLYVGKQRFEAPGPLPQDRIVNLARGSGIRDIADALVREGVIDQPWVFVGGVLVLKAREDLKAGEYQFKAHASLRDVVETIVEGKVVTHQFSVPEGLTSEQIVARLMDDDVLSGNIKEIPREGNLLPDTYNFTRSVTREQMIQRMQQAQQRLVKEIWDRRSSDLPIKTPEQLVILASLVEKETGKPDERTRVAAVFVNRLKQKMRLQSDPTIIYGLVGGKGTLGRPIMKSEIEQPTPYNTYMIDGLPPGPIANPGRASLEAAANPARTRELYFVADGTGGHAFAETYEQHLKNVARLRSAEADQRDQAPAYSQDTAIPAQQAPSPGTPPAGRTSGHNRRTSH
jgi:UPF0755 protein